MIKSLRRYANVQSELPQPIEQGEGAEGDSGQPLARDGAPTSLYDELLCWVRAWAGNERKRWKRLHAALLRIYTPSWERVDARDILVAWAAANLALTQAGRELTRLQGLKRPLTGRELDAKSARQADVSFWGRLAHRLAAQVPAALAHDAEARRVLVTLVSKNKGGGQ